MSNQISTSDMHAKPATHTETPDASNAEYILTGLTAFFDKLDMLSVYVFFNHNTTQKLKEMLVENNGQDVSYDFIMTTYTHLLLAGVTNADLVAITRAQDVLLKSKMLDIPSENLEIDGMFKIEQTDSSSSAAVVYGVIFILKLYTKFCKDLIFKLNNNNKDRTNEH